MLLATSFRVRLEAQPDRGKLDPVLPKFSVVSIRPSNPDGPVLFQWTGTGFVAKGTTSFWLTQTAYELPEERFLEHAPSRVGEQRFDVTAKVDDADQAVFSAMHRTDRDKMLQPILTERFGLTYRWDSRIFPEYSLIVKDAVKASRALPLSSAEDAAKPVWRISHPYSVDARGISMEELCNLLLGTEAQLLVVDQTGLTGKYTFHLSWSRVDTSVNPSPSTDTNNAPNIFTAVQEQLGLKMVPIRVPVKVMVIDSIHQPSPN